MNPGVTWAPGALDGVGLYHTAYQEMTEDQYALMAAAIGTAALDNYEAAEEKFDELTQQIRAIYVIDSLQTYIMDREDEWNIDDLLRFAVHALHDTARPECVKVGLCLLELIDIEDSEELKNAVRKLGRSDEYTLFAIFVMQQWEDGNEEIFRLAQDVHGWGRIHTVERLTPATPEIREWLLCEGVHNDVMAAYSALPCWQKSGAAEVLKGSPSRKAYEGIRDILLGLLDEGPVAGISRVDNAKEVLQRFLALSETMAASEEDEAAVRTIREYCETME